MGEGDKAGLDSVGSFFSVWEDHEVQEPAHLRGEGVKVSRFARTPRLLGNRKFMGWACGEACVDARCLAYWRPNRPRGASPGSCIL